MLLLQLKVTCHDAQLGFSIAKFDLIATVLRLTGLHAFGQCGLPWACEHIAVLRLQQPVGLHASLRL